MTKRSRLLLGVTGAATFLFATVLCLTATAERYKPLVNEALGISGTNVSTFKGSDYADPDGNLSDEGFYRLVHDVYNYCEQQEEEGSVLLYNNGALPLAKNERKVSLFGKHSTNPFYRSGAGGPIADAVRQVDWLRAFKGETPAESFRPEDKFEVNPNLYAAYQQYTRRADGSTIPTSASANEVGEADVAFFSSSEWNDNNVSDSLNTYKDAAIVILARYGSEGSDLTRSTTDHGLPLLALDPHEADMLRWIKNSGKFSKTIVLINGSFPMELDWLKDEQYGVDACLWVGNPGYYGLGGVVNVLSGKANPSGHLMETYATDSLSSPAMQNFGDINFDVNGYVRGEAKDKYGIGGDITKMVVYAEGCYVDYKYYETRYEDLMYNRYGANSSAGTFASKGINWDYSDEVCYPFGFGLSYTTFDYKINSVDYNAGSDTFTANVTAKNTGTVDGKGVVQVYAQSPYTDYDRENKIDKSAIQLLNYEKVALRAGEEKTFNIELDRYLLATYDEYKQKGYIWEPGDYYFAVGNGAHDALNAIINLKGGHSGTLEDHDGNPVSGSSLSGKAVKYTQGGSIDTQKYKMSRYNNEQQVTNIFDDCDINYFSDSEVNYNVKYLKRNDWANTFPQKYQNLKINEKMYEAMRMDRYEKPANGPSVDDVPHNVLQSPTLLFSDMVGVPYDDPKWDLFIQQLDLDELAISVSDYRGIGAVDKIKKPASTVAEGPEGMLATFKYGDGRHTTGYGTLPLVASSFDHELQLKHGHMYGEEALFAGVTMVNGPGANLVRTPYLGRVSEYFSADGVLNYYCSAHVCGGMAERGLIGNLKHCFLNNQETNRQKVSTFSQEQGMRELYARAWEGAFTLGKGMGVMTAYNRIGVTYTASSVALNDTLFRKEWNFKGSIIDDAMSQSAYSNMGDMLEAGTNLFCLDGQRGGLIVKRIKDTDDGHLLELLQRANKRLMYALTTSSLGGVQYEAEKLTWWEGTLVAVNTILGAGVVAGTVAYVLDRIKVSKAVRKED